MLKNDAQMAHLLYQCKATSEKGKKRYEGGKQREMPSELQIKLEIMQISCYYRL